MSDASAGETSSKHVAVDQLAERIASERDAGRSIVLCHGVFDLLHPGHFRHLKAAKERGDVLVVSITADAFVNKGPGRPVFGEQLRAEALSGLQAVDVVVISPEATALTILEIVRPDSYVKGTDYADPADDPTGNIAREREVVERHGGQMVFTDEIVFSSSNLVNRFMPQHPPAVLTSLAELRETYGIEEILHYLDLIADLRVVVVGETILDSYTTCEALGKASKEPVLCMRLGESVTYAGGILAIGRHCRGLGAASTTVITGINSRDAGNPIIQSVGSIGVDLRTIMVDPSPTIAKTSIVDQQTQARVLELYEIDDSPVSSEAEAGIIAALDDVAADTDLVIVADYGHGFFTDDVIRHVASLPTTLALNVQTNAGNRGFNSISKYPRADFATLNGGEARLEVRRRHGHFSEFVPALREKLGAGALLVTQGGSGTDMYLDDGRVTHSPALAPFVKDRVGAGDTVFAVASMLFAVGAPPEIIGFVGNVAGAWSVSFIGNEQALAVGTIKRQITSILK